MKTFSFPRGIAALISNETFNLKTDFVNSVMSRKKHGGTC